MLILDTPETETFRHKASDTTDIDPATPHHAGTFAKPAYVDDATFIDELARIACDGKKRGTPHMQLDFEHENIRMREPGNRRTMTADVGDPLCVVRITNVDIKPFHLAGEVFAASEGEGGLSLEHWRGAHLGYFKPQCQAWGHEWPDDGPVACESLESVSRP